MRRPPVASPPDAPPAAPAGSHALAARADLPAHAADRARLQRLVVAHGLKISRGAPFKLSAGGTSPYLFDLKPVMLEPEAAGLLGRLLAETVRGFGGAYAGGREIGGVPLAALVARESFPAAPVKGFFVRKQPKDHGTQTLVEGNVPPAGARVVVLEDVTTTGASVLDKSIPHLRALGAEVVGVVTVVDRQQGAAERFEQAGVPFRWLFRLSDFPELREFLQGR